MNPTTKQSYVYVIIEEGAGNGCCKLGVSDNVESRRRTLQTGNSHKLVVIGKWAVDRLTENALHLHFAKYRRIGEWFELPAFSGLAILRVVNTPISPTICSDGDDIRKSTARGQNILQHEIIGLPSEYWIHLKDRSKPPIPFRHVVNPAGRKKIEGQNLIAYEILRKIQCHCGIERRLTAGYISAMQMAEILQEDRETQIGIIRQFLRKRVLKIDMRIASIMCAKCLGAPRN